MNHQETTEAMRAMSRRIAPLVSRLSQVNEQIAALESTRKALPLDAPQSVITSLNRRTAALTLESQDLDQRLSVELAPCSELAKAAFKPIIDRHLEQAKEVLMPMCAHNSERALQCAELTHPVHAIRQFLRYIDHSGNCSLKRGNEILEYFSMHIASEGAT